MILRTESSIRLVITEVQLPLLDGRTMVAMARGRRPELCVLFTTRHPETLALSHDGVLAQAGMDMLLKPFDLDLLVSRVHTLLQHFVHRS